MRADGIGDWANALEIVLTGPCSQFIREDYKTLQKEILQKHSTSASWQYQAVDQLDQVLKIFGVDNYGIPQNPSLREWFKRFALLRNKTRGHGAISASKYSNAVPLLEESINNVISELQIFKWQWAYLHRNLSGKYRVSKISEENDQFKLLSKTSGENLTNGIYIYRNEPVQIDLLESDPELSDFFVPNGQFRGNEYECISYITGKIKRVEASRWIVPASCLPDSETHGLLTLEAQGNVFTNVPCVSTDYIQRSELEGAIEEALRLKRHEIITLSGPGGIGKTSIGISVIRKFFDDIDQRFNNIIWFSARDIDLLPSGPKSVRPHGVSLSDFAEQYVEYLGISLTSQKELRKPEEILADALTNTPIGPTLYIFDNFETVINQSDTFKWIDTYIRSPNKVLITTRNRDFIGDYPISIHGMTDIEASRLIRSVAQSLNINEIITLDYEQSLIDESSGHPYVIKIMLGELEKEKRLIKPKRIMASQEGILQALFERTYSTLSPAAHRIFLLLSSWRSIVPSLAIEAVVMRNADERIDVRCAIDELKKISFIEEIYSGEGDESFISLPLAALTFGLKKLNTSPLKAVIESDSELLQAFGAITKDGINKGVKMRVLHLLGVLAHRISIGKDDIEALKPMLDFVGSRVPSVWVEIAQLYIEEGGEYGQEWAKDALRRLLESSEESIPHVQIWQKLVVICHQTGDLQGEMQALVEISGSSSVSVDELSALADNINRIFSIAKKENKPAFQTDERKHLLGKLIGRLEQCLHGLDAIDLSRLAWLYLHIGNEERALQLVSSGLDMDPNNSYCLKIQERLMQT